MNYRGYGGSSGKPYEKALYSDALALFDYIKPKHKNISVIGRSLGSGVATYLASQRKIRKMILVTPFDSIGHIAANRYFMFPVSMLLEDKFNSVNRVERIKVPVLVITAALDKVIESKYSSALIAAFPAEQVEVENIAGSGHNNIGNKREYWRAIRYFLDK